MKKASAFNISRFRQRNRHLFPPDSEYRIRRIVRNLTYTPDKQYLKAAGKALMAEIADPCLKEFFHFQMAIRFFKRTGSKISTRSKGNRPMGTDRPRRLTGGNNNYNRPVSSLYYSGFYGLPIDGMHAEVSVARQMIDAMTAEKNRVMKNRKKLFIPGLGATENTEDPLHQ